MKLDRLSKFYLVIALASSMFSVPLELAAGESEDMNFAKKLRRDGMHVAAAEEFLRFSEKYPQSAFRAEALFSAGESYLEAGKASEALSVYERFVEQYPEDERACLALFQRGRIFEALKRYGEAIEEFLAIAKESPACPVRDQAVLEAADCRISMGDSQGAIGMLRDLANEAASSELAARARYSLSVALSNNGKDLEAEAVLADIVSKHPRSPFRALALLELAERASAKGDYRKAYDYCRMVEKEYKDPPFPEKAAIGIIDVEKARGNTEELFSQCERFLERYPGSDRRYGVMRTALDAAWALKRYDRALILADSMLASKSVQDTTGELSLLAARILVENGKSEKALARLYETRRKFPESRVSAEALVLEGNIRERLGEPLEAARLYNLAMLENIPREKRVELHTRLAEISRARLADTLSALRHYRAVIEEDREGSMAEKALYASSRLREASGDLRGAERGYEELAFRFPGSMFADSARVRLAAISAMPNYGETVARKLARISVWQADLPYRLLETAAVLVEEARDAEAAIPLLEKVREGQIQDSLRAKAGYYLGRAYIMKASSAEARAERSSSIRDKGLEILRETMSRYPGITWAEKSHRAFIEAQAASLPLAQKLARIEEYLAVYGSSTERYWGLARKAEWLHELAARGDTAAARKALEAARSVMAADAPQAEKKLATYIAASTMRSLGDHAGAVRAYESFVSAWPKDPRVASALYELGESRLELKDFPGALSAFELCLASAPGRSLADKCNLRIGDCFYYEGRFEDAARAYSKLAEESGALALESLYRKAMAVERAGEPARAEEILSRLVSMDDVTESVRKRALEWLGSTYSKRGDYARAKPLLDKLASLERTARNLVLAAEVSMEIGDYRSAERSFTEALASSGVDSCRALIGRARASLRLGNAQRSDADVREASSKCPSSYSVAAVLLEKGRMEVEGGRCDEGAAALEKLRKDYPDSPEGKEALYHLAICDLKRGGYGEASAKLETFIRSAPSSSMIPQAYFKLASAQVAAGNLNLAARNYALAAESSSDRDLSFSAMKNLGRVYERLEQWNEAAVVWQKLAESYTEREDVVEILFDLGMAYGQAGKGELAYDVYRRIPDIAKDDTQRGRAHYWAGMTLKNMGRCEDAVREFLRVPYLRTEGMWGVTSKLEAASCYEALGDLIQAKSIYEGVIAANGEGSDWGRVAKEGLKRIEERERTGASKRSNGGE